LGIRVTGGKLKEEIIPRPILKQKNIYLQNGFCSLGDNTTFDLRSWNLFKGQRALIPLAAAKLFLDYVNRIHPDSILIIDEFRPTPFYLYPGDLGLPRNLYARNKEYKNFKRNYKNAGKNISYYPLYSSTFYKFLHSTGFRDIKFDIEQKLAANMAGKKWIQIKEHYFSRAFIARARQKPTNTSIPLTYNPTKII
jgi:hypothetical protein